MASAVPRRRLQLQQHPHTPSGDGLQILGEVSSVPCNRMPLGCCFHRQHQRVAMTRSL